MDTKYNLLNKQIDKLQKCNMCCNIIKYKYISNDCIKKKCACSNKCNICGKFKEKKSYIQNNMYIQIRKCNCNNNHNDYNNCIKCGKQYDIKYIGTNMILKCKCKNVKMHETYDNNGLYFNVIL